MDSNRRLRRQKLSATSTNMELKVLRTRLYAAQRQDLVEKNVATKVDNAQAARRKQAVRLHLDRSWPCFKALRRSRRRMARLDFHRPLPENNRNRLERSSLQTDRTGRKSQKLPTPVVGNKPNGKSQSN
jgi:hypothetical protein